MDDIEERLRAGAVEIPLLAFAADRSRASTLVEAADEIARLKGENERRGAILAAICEEFAETRKADAEAEGKLPGLVKSYLDMLDGHVLKRRAAEAALSRNQALIEEMVEGLRPFARIASTFDFAIGPDGIDDGLNITLRTVAHPEHEAVLSTTDFSKARTLIAKATEPDHAL